MALKDTLWILGLQFLLLIFRTGQVPLLGPDEPRYARVAVEMSRANEFVTPTLSGIAWLEKPPLYYWFAGLAYRVLGENEFAARLPAVFASLFFAAVAGMVGARLFGSGCGRLTMLILATSPLAFAYGRVATMDMLVAAFVTGAVGLFILSIVGVAGPSAVPAAWALMAIATLAKGPIGFVIPLGVALAAGVLIRPFSWSRIVSPLGVGLSVAIAGPWFAAIWRDQGFHFIEVFILNHNIQRFTSTVHNHPGPFFYYVPILLLGIFPWSGLIALIPRAVRAIESKAIVAMMAWIAVPLVFFSLAGSKLPGYILPSLPPFAIVLARSARFLQLPERSKALRATGLIGLVIAAALVALSVRAIREGEPWGRSALLPAVWSLAIAFVFSRSLERARSESLRILSIGAAGFLLLLTLVAPPVLDAMESGRRLFLPARGREVLVAGAWRTAWMSGYFYNDGHVTDVGSLENALSSVRKAPCLVLLGASEWSQLQKSIEFSTLKLADGPRGNVLALVSLRTNS